MKVSPLRQRELKELANELCGLPADEFWYMFFAIEKFNKRRFVTVLEAGKELIDERDRQLQKKRFVPKGR